MIHKTLSTFNFRSILVRIIKPVVETLLGIIILLSICNRLNYMYVTYDPYHRILFKSYYDQDNIDNIFLGSSHVYCDIDPRILDNINGENNFNLATPGQRWDNTYYLLKDAIERYDIKSVYLECYHRMSTEYEIWDKEIEEYQVVDWMDSPDNFSRPWLITYEMKPSYNSFIMLLNSSDEEHMLETIFPFVRYRQNIFNWEQIKTNIEIKNSDEFNDGTYHENLVDVDGTAGFVEYYEKGIWFSENLRLLDQEKLLEADRNFNRYGIGNNSEKYIRKPLEMLQEKGINTKMYISPVYDLQLISTEDYDKYICELKNIADEYRIEIYDFNLIKDDYLDIKDGDLFMDIGHLNGRGQELFTPVLWNVLSGTKEENSVRFFESYEGKLSSEEPEIYGLYYRDIGPTSNINTDGSPIYSARHYSVASNRNDMEYRIIRTVIDEKTEVEKYSEVIQEYDENKSFDLPIGEHGILVVDAKCGGQNLQLSVEY